ncbi:hypothetical protein AAFF_G00276620 [Aldrovandia affinis]|uniref:G0/G1 switch protein 2 n=1 Tax=Aldrovandia affinis TaxID=143900 RepID=A0AAD7RAW7_9TELE|nr:hypothetical protein AAFF_G00276620 [Aldrovandia affinis]
MESIHEIVPFAREMLRQRPSRAMVRVYVLGSLLALVGLAIGLVETVCETFSRAEPPDEDLARFIARERRRLEKREEESAEGWESSAAMEAGAASKQGVTAAPRNSANRLHAS